MTTQQYQVHMTYRDRFGRHNMTHWVMATSPVDAALQAQDRLLLERQATPTSTKVYASSSNTDLLKPLVHAEGKDSDLLKALGFPVGDQL